MAEHGLRPSFLMHCACRDSIAPIKDLMRGGDAPSAIFTTNLHATRHVLNALGRLRVRIPHDVAVICFDDFESADPVPVPLTAVRQPAREMGRAATERIIEQLQTKPALKTPPQNFKFSAELILRQSCGCRP